MYPLNMVFGPVPRPQLYPKAGAGTPTRRPFARTGDNDRVFANHGQHPLSNPETLKSALSSLTRFKLHLRSHLVAYKVLECAFGWVEGTHTGNWWRLRVCGFQLRCKEQLSTCAYAGSY